MNKNQFKHRQDIIKYLQEVATDVRGDLDKYNDRVGGIRQGMVHLKRSDIFWLKGNYKQAAQESKESLKFLPDCIEAMRLLSDSLYSIEKYEEAIESYLVILRKYPESNDIHYQLGRCYLELEDYQRAIEEFNKEMVVSGSAHDIHLQLGVANYRLAQRTIEELRGQETSEAKERIERCCKRLEKAKDHCQKALGAADQVSLNALIHDINNLLDCSENCHYGV